MGLGAWALQAQAQSRIELDTLSWFSAGDGNGLAPGTYTKPGSPEETIVSTIPQGGPPKVFCNSVFGLSNNGQTIINGSGKGFFQSLNDYGGTYTLTRTYKVTPGRLTYMKVRMATIPQPWLLVSNITATIDGRSLGRADRYNSSWEKQQFLEGSQVWTPTTNLVKFEIAITAPGGCHADEEILYVDQFYQVTSNILAVDDRGSPVDSNGGQVVANVLVNDVLGGAGATLTNVNLSQVSSTNAKVTLNPATGAVTVAPGTPAATYQLVYQICDKANPGNCSQATVSVTVDIAYPKISLKKVLGGGGRLRATDQFTLQLTGAYEGLITSTTKGSGSTIEAGTGVVAFAPADVNGYYTVGEVMASGSGSSLSAYTATTSCKNLGSGGTDVSFVKSAADQLYLNYGDIVECTITNSSPGAKLAIKQVLAPGTPAPPFSYNYSVNNGWGTVQLTSNASGEPGTTSALRDLAATATATAISVTDLPLGWRIVPEASACTDGKGAVTGNGSSSFGTLSGNVLTAPAANVRIGSELLCTLTLGLAAPTLTLNKALGSARIRSSDQFTVQLQQGSNVVASGTTTGSGASVDAGSGSTGVFSAVAGSSYTLGETMAAGSGSSLAQYTAAVSCRNDGVGGTAVGGIRSLNSSITPQAGDAIVCTITNAVGVATLTVRQQVREPLPVNLVGPFVFDYSGDNGWGTATLRNPASETTVSTTAVNLATTNTATTVSTTLPTTRWQVIGFSCVDGNAANSGNPNTVLARSSTTSITVPAAYVVPGAALRCTLALGHTTP